MLNLGLKFKSAVRISVSAGVLGVAAWGALSSVAQTGGAAKGDDQTKTQSTPYYCRVKALNRTEWTRLHTLAAKVSGARTELKATARWLRVSFAERPSNAGGVRGMDGLRPPVLPVPGL
jgi:hypothetical protein